MSFIESSFFADEPLSKPEQDSLHRKHIVDALVEVLRNSTESSNSSVVALSGAWGSGKTSLINFTKMKLKSEANNSKSPLSGTKVVDYSPWLFVDINSLLIGFFSVIQGALPEKKGDTARKHLSKYANGLATVAKVPALVGLPDASGALKAIGGAIDVKDSLDKTKGKIVKELEKLSHKVIIVIDDLDRLHPDELLLIFKLIRSVARFPNVYYLLSFDEQTILDLLSTTGLAQGDRARATAYVEKIVQIRIDLPPLHESHHQTIFMDGIQAVAKKTGLELSESETLEIYRIYRKHLSLWLSTPRSIRRMFAQLLSSYSLVHGEVSFKDFFLMNFLRTFEAGTHHLLAIHKARLTGNTTAWEFEKKIEPAEAKEFWENELKALKVPTGKIPALMIILGLLFSSIKTALSNHPASISTFDLQSDQRVESTVYFDRYFQLSVPYGDVPDRLVRRGIERLLESDSDSMHVTLLSQSIKKLPFKTLQKMRIIVSSLEGNFSTVSEFAAKSYSTLPDDREFIVGSSSDEVAYLLRDLLDKGTADDVSQTVALLSREENIILGSSLESRISRIDEKPSWYEPLRKKMSDALNVRVSAMGTTKLDEISDDEFLLFFRWARITGIERAKLWAQSNVESGNWTLPSYMGHLVSVAVSYGDGGKIRRIHDWENGELEQYLDIDWAIDKLGTQLDQEFLPLSELRATYPTQENKVSYALASLARIKRQKDVSLGAEN